MSKQPAASLGFELSLLKDELLYGWLARHVSLLRLKGGRGLLPLLLDQPTMPGTPALPGKLQRLAQRLPSGQYGFNDLLLEHTTFPYYASFTPPIRSNKLREAMRDGWAGTERRTGRGSAVAQHATLLYCRSCRSEQISATGAATWNRVHQAPGVFRCHEHDEPLMASNVRAKNAVTLWPCPMSDDGCAEVDSPLKPSSALRIAKLTAWFTRRPATISSDAQLRAAVSRLLGKAGWLHPSGVIRANFGRELARHFDGQALERLGIREVRGRTSWMHRMAGFDSGISHPLMYLLSFDFFGLSEQDLRDFPWASSDFSELCLEAATAPSHRRVEILTPRLRGRYREAILAELRAGHTRSQIRHKNRHRFKAMRAEDRAWLDANVPAPPRRKARGGTLTQDEEERFATAVSEAVHRMRGADGCRPRRITMGTILNETGRSRELWRRRGLERARQIATAACQTVPEHHEALLRWSADRYRAEGRVPTFTAFARRASVQWHVHKERLALARQIYAEMAASFPLRS